MSQELSAALEVEARSLQTMHREVITELDNLKVAQKSCLPGWLLVCPVHIRALPT